MKKVMLLILGTLEIGGILGFWFYAMISQYIGYQNFIK